MSAAAPTLGERLKAERERKGFSMQKAADQLHLDAWVIEALESGDYARIGPAVYGKGHLKRYAVLLGLPLDEVLEAYEPDSRAPAVQSAPAPRLRMRTSEPLGRTIPWRPAGGLAAALVLAGLLWWRPWHTHKAPPAAPVVAAVEPAAGSGSNSVAADDGWSEHAADAAGTAGSPAAGTAPTAASAASADGAAAPRAAALTPAPAAPRATASLPAAAPPRPAAAPAASPPPAAAALAGAGSPPLSAAAAHRAAAAGRGAEAPGAGRARLRLSFSADSWVEVHDATGRSLFAGNGRANSVKTVVGVAPMTVYLGSASGVQLEVNNHAVAIGPQFVAGDAAHFAAGADGVLRRDAHPPPVNQPHPRG
jgi:cytoskeleton protein RodZ